MRIFQFAWNIETRNFVRGISLKRCSDYFLTFPWDERRRQRRWHFFDCWSVKHSTSFRLFLTGKIMILTCERISRWWVRPGSIRRSRGGFNVFATVFKSWIFRLSLIRWKNWFTVQFSFYIFFKTNGSILFRSWISVFRSSCRLWQGCDGKRKWSRIGKTI